MKKACKGFTLIELLVVIALIGVLSTLIMANLNAARERSRDIQRKSDLKNIATALELYNNSHSAYPANLTALTDGSFISAIPADPLGEDRTYTYTFVSSDSYTLTACLENKSDSKCDATLCADDTGCVYTVRSQ